MDSKWLSSSNCISKLVGPEIFEVGIIDGSKSNLIIYFLA